MILIIVSKTDSFIGDKKNGWKRDSQTQREKEKEECSREKIQYFSEMGCNTEKYI